MDPIERKSWEWEWRWIKDPTHRNSSALNNACVIKWKKAKVGRLRPSLAIITPSCLNVDKATIFFISHSVIALNPAINIVSLAIKRRKVLKNSIWWRKK